MTNDKGLGEECAAPIYSIPHSDLGAFSPYVCNQASCPQGAQNTIATKYLLHTNLIDSKRGYQDTREKEQKKEISTT